MLKFLKVFFVFILVVAIFGYISYRYLMQKMDDIDNAALKPITIYKISSGFNTYDIIHDLVQNSEKHIFYRIWLKFVHPEFAKFRAGTFSIEGANNLVDALNLLKNSHEVSFNFTIVEGTRYEQVIDRLSKQDHLNQDLSECNYQDIFELNVDNHEGLLMADTYTYTIDDKASSIIKRAYKDLNDFLNDEWNNKAENLPYKTPYEALIMASIVEKETSIKDEYPLVAAVFCNRLNKNMKLQTDPTVIYGVKDRYDGNIHRKDLEDANPYNTYVIDGLPPTPIAIASKGAIHAVMHPADVPYLFFVANGNGGHTFTNNLKDHNKAVSSYLKFQRDHRNAVKNLSTTLDKQVKEIIIRENQANE